MSQDEEGRTAPLDDSHDTAAAARGHTRARVRWLLACPLHRNPASAAYRSCRDSDAGPALGSGTPAATKGNGVTVAAV